MATRRGNGEGSFRKRADGRYQGRLTYIDRETGETKVAYSYGKTQREARDKLNEVRDRIEAGQPAKDAAITVAAWMTTWREGSLQASKRKKTTKSLYSSLSRTHLETDELAINDRRLDKLRPVDIEAMIVQLQTGGKYADSTIRQIYTILRQALDTAVRDGMLGVNPATKVPRPGIKKKEAKYLTPAEVAKILEHTKTMRYHTAVVLMATSGLRRGEICGLSWSDIDLTRGELKVRNTLSRIDKALVLDDVKTNSSRRTVPLHPSVIPMLKDWRKQQLEERLKAGSQWVDTGMVFCTNLGTMVDPRNLLRCVETAAKKAGIDNAGAHTMRHSAAVAWLENGIHIKAAADLLGHSSISITGDLYGHTSPEIASKAVGDLGAALGL